MASQKLLRSARYYARKYPHTHIRGMERVVDNLNAAIGRMIYKSERGLVEAALHIRTETETKPYATPLDIGNLRASWFIVSPSRTEKDPDGFSGHFKNNRKRGFTSGQFRAWHTEAVTEAKALVGMDPNKITVMMGYSAIYAMWVHENTEATFKERSPAAGPKWFQNALNRNHKKMLKIIRETSKIPGTL
jgi:hypothetical protein